jgi:hypothetical protein
MGGGWFVISYGGRGEGRGGGERERERAAWLGT